MSVDQHTPRSRRNILAAALGVVGAAVATTLGRAAPVEAANGDPLLMGNAFNSSASPTVLTIGGDNPMPGAFRVDATSTVGGPTVAISGASYAGPGVAGASIGHLPGSVGVQGVGLTGVMGSVGGLIGESAQPAGVYGVGSLTGGPGVMGQGFVAPGVLGKGTGTVGVQGITDSSYGPAVQGWSLYQTGVEGYVGTTGFIGSGLSAGEDGVRGLDDTQSGVGRGVYGYSKRGSGVLAEAPSTGVALKVKGKAAFSRSGRLSITSGHSSIVKSLAGVTTSSLILAVLQTHRSGVYVTAAVPGSGKFTIYLSKAVTATTYVAYFVIN